MKTILYLSEPIQPVDAGHIDVILLILIDIPGKKGQPVAGSNGPLMRDVRAHGVFLGHPQVFFYRPFEDAFGDGPDRGSIRRE